MNYLEQIEAAWSQLRGQTPEASKMPLRAQADSGILVAEVANVESLACSAWSVCFQPNTPLDAAPVAEQLTSRLRYLFEPLQLLEFDKTAGIAQVRSAPPFESDAQTRCYFELLVRSDAISLRRYAKAPRQPRQAIPAALTRDVFLRLANDFATSTLPQPLCRTGNRLAR